ncbi:20637_t:CDS:2 [Rhizophagus irregularis]|nr:20637_t:CDS:2 [Rhizophagus irregularis]
MEKEMEMEVPLIIVEPNDENIGINLQRSSRGFENYYLNNNLPPHNSKKITKIVYEKEGKSGKEIRYNSRFQKEELSDLLMVSNDRYVLVRISKKEQDEFRIVKLDEKENEIFYVKGNPAYDQGTFISSNNDFFIIYKKELEAYVYHTSQVIVNKRETNNEYNRDITTIWQIKSKYKFVFPQQFWQKEIRPPIGFFLTPEKLFLTYKGSNILSQWDLSTMTFEKQYLLELNKRNIHPAAKVDDDIFELKQTMVVDGSKKNIMAIHGYSTFNYEHQILVYSMNSTSNISIVGTSKNDGGLLIYGFNAEGKPEYFLHDLNDLDFCENAETISSIIPDQVDAQLVVNKELSDKIVIAKDSKLIVHNISEEELKMLRDKLKLKKLKKDQSDKDFKYYPYPYPSSIVKTILEMLEGLDWNRSADLPEEYTCKELDSIKWSVNHWKKTGKTAIKVSELIYVDNESGKKLCEWKELDEFKYFPPREIFVFACKCIENGDLIMITKQGIRIFTIIQPSKKIKMRYFWDNDRWREIWKSSKKLEKPFDFDQVKVELSRRRNKLPPLDITRLIELYETFYVENNYRIWPFKDLLRNYLQDTTTLAKYGKKILYKAIDAKKGNIVELICNMCLNFLEKDSDNFYLLRIIVKCLPKLQQNYPDIVAEFMAKSSMILDHQCFIVTNSEYTLIHGYSRDVMIYEKNTFWDHYHQIQFFYYKIYNIIKNVIETISGGEEEEKFVPVDEVRKQIHQLDSTARSSSNYSPIISSRLRDIVDVPKSYNQQQQDLLSEFEAINSFLKKINGEGIHRQFSISSIGNTSKLFKPGTPGTRDIKTYFSDPDGTYID